MKILILRNRVRNGQRALTSGIHQKNENENENTDELNENKNTRFRRRMARSKTKKTGLNWRKYRDSNSCASFSELDELQPPKRFK